MGVYNPWAEMPRSCVVCDYRDKCPIFSQNFYGLSSYKHDCCPLVEIPVPHGRIVDVDELPSFCVIDSLENTRCVLWREIDDAPTIIEAEGKDDG